jgi:hypothetical protein
MIVQDVLLIQRKLNQAEEALRLAERLVAEAQARVDGDATAKSELGNVLTATQRDNLNAIQKRVGRLRDGILRRTVGAEVTEPEVGGKA